MKKNEMAVGIKSTIEFERLEYFLKEFLINSKKDAEKFKDKKLFIDIAISGNIFFKEDGDSR